MQANSDKRNKIQQAILHTKAAIELDWEFKNYTQEDELDSLKQGNSPLKNKTSATFEARKNKVSNNPFMLLAAKATRFLCVLAQQKTAVSGKPPGGTRTNKPLADILGSGPHLKVRVVLEEVIATA